MFEPTNLNKPFSIMEWPVLSLLIAFVIAATVGVVSLLFYVYGVPASSSTIGWVGSLSGLLICLVWLFKPWFKR